MNETSLEQRILEAAEKATPNLTTGQWCVLRDGITEAMPVIKDLLEEKNREIKRLKGLSDFSEYDLLHGAECIRRVNLMANGDPTWDLSDNDRDALSTVLTILNSKNVSLETALRERDDFKRIAGQYREQDRSHSDCDEHPDHEDCDERCKICREYDALTGKGKPK